MAKKENKTGRIVISVFRVLFGAILLFASLSYFLNLVPQPELSGDMKLFNDGLNAAGYLLPLLKSIELLCGIALIVNRYVVLASLIIFPIVINILAVHLFLAPEGLPIALFVFTANLLLLFRNKAHYKSLLVN